MATDPKGMDDRRVSGIYQLSRFWGNDEKVPIIAATISSLLVAPDSISGASTVRCAAAASITEAYLQKYATARRTVDFRGLGYAMRGYAQLIRKPLLYPAELRDQGSGAWIEPRQAAAPERMWIASSALSFHRAPECRMQSEQMPPPCGRAPRSAPTPIFAKGRNEAYPRAVD